MAHFILTFLILTTGHAFIEAEPRPVLSSYPVGIDKCNGEHRVRRCYPRLDDGDGDEPFILRRAHPNKSYYGHTPLRVSYSPTQLHKGFSGPQAPSSISQAPPITLTPTSDPTVVEDGKKHTGESRASTPNSIDEWTAKEKIKNASKNLRRKVKNDNKYNDMGNTLEGLVARVEEMRKGLKSGRWASQTNLGPRTPPVHPSPLPSQPLPSSSSWPSQSTFQAPNPSTPHVPIKNSNRKRKKGTSYDRSLKRYETIELQSKSLREKIAGLEKDCGEQQASQSTPISNFSHRPWKLKDLVKLANELEKSVGELESDLKG